MRFGKSLIGAALSVTLSVALLSLAPLAAHATPLVRGFKVIDGSGAPVTGATIKSVLVAPYTGSNVTLTGGAGNVTFAVTTSGTPSTLPATAPGAAATYNVREVGNGVYLMAFDEDASGEAVLIPTVTKAGVDYTADPIYCTNEAQKLDTKVSTRQASGSAVTLPTLPNVTVGGYANGIVPPDSAGTTTLLSRLPQNVLFTSGGFVKAFSILDFTQTLDVSQTATDTVGAALNGASTLIGKGVITGTPGTAGSTIKIYSPSGVLLKTFSLVAGGSRQ